MKYDLSKEHDKKKASEYFWKLYAEGAKIELKKPSKPRTNQQNKYLHVLIGLIAISEGYTLDEMKQLLKNKGGVAYIKDGNIFYKRTSDMDTKQIGEFIDFVFNFGSDLGLNMPTPEDYNNYWFTLEQQIQKGNIY